jgi:hypothetical protein
MQDAIVNKVAERGLVTLDLEDYYPKDDVAVFDLKDYLFMGMILKEKDFRTALQNINWSQYENKNIGLTCSADAIIPMWAYMLVASYLRPFAKEILFGNKEAAVAALILKNLAKLNGEDFTDKRVVIKGCGDVQIPEAAYIEITSKLRPFAKSIMYGEPCSTVPIYKKK